MSDEHSNTDPSAPDDSAGRWSRRAKFGVFLVMASGVFFVAIFVIPFLPLRAGEKVVLVGVAYACMQIAWWVGIALAGPHTIRRLRRMLRRKTPAPK